MTESQETQGLAAELLVFSAMLTSCDIQNVSKDLAGVMQELEDTHTSLDHQQEARQGMLGYLKWQ